MHPLLVPHHVFHGILLSAHLVAPFRKLFYAILLSPLAPKRPTSAQLKSALSRKSPYKRIMSTVNLVDIMIPGFVNRLYRSLFRNNRFPWLPVDTELIAFGSGAAVYKLNWKNG